MEDTGSISLGERIFCTNFLDHSGIYATFMGDIAQYRG